MQEEVQKLLFILNPVSGGNSKQDWEPVIRQYFKKLPHSIEFYLMTGKNDSVSIQHYIELLNPDKIVAVGGDGTVKLVAELVRGTGRVMGVLPAGSANGMARELALPLEQDAALEVILHGECRPIDAIVINEAEICIHLSDMGLNAMLVKYFDETPGRGMWGYARSLFRVLWRKQTLHANITTDSGSVHRRAYMIVLANASKYGTGATINPKGSLEDGLFEVVVVRRLNLWTILKVLLSHKDFKERNIEILQTKSLRLTTLRKAYFQVDGEYRGRIKEIEARVVPGCINMMLPVKTEVTGI